jgi:release factor glutamine methyltransferase
MSTVPPFTELITKRLMAAGCVAADEEAAELVAAAPGDTTLEQWVRRREQGEPLAWITGSLQFCGHSLHVDPGVYVPRLQTEELARRAARFLKSGGVAVDLCTGTGAVAVHLVAEAPMATVCGVDLDIRAVRCARRNGVPALVGDLDRPLRAKAFDMVTASPYMPTEELRFLPTDVQRYEPVLALDGGADGLDLVRRIVVSASRLLRPGGWLLVELGGRQDLLLSPDLAESGFAVADRWFDEDGDLRGLAAQAEGRPTRNRSVTARPTL